MSITVMFLSEFSAQLLRLLFFADREEGIIRISKFEKCRRDIQEYIIHSIVGFFLFWLFFVDGENTFAISVRDEKLKRHVEKFGERKVGLIN